jgi:hypothetical protein
MSAAIDLHPERLSPKSIARKFEPAISEVKRVARGKPAESRMSALGQKRTLRCLHPMSALPPKAEIRWQSLLLPKLLVSLR